MNGNHVSGGVLGFLVGAVAARYGWQVSQDEAGMIGLALAWVGGTLAHVFTGPGLVPAVKRGLFGAKQD